MNKGTYLLTGERLQVGDYLVSPSGNCHVILDSDGRFCLWKGPGPERRGEGLWASFLGAGQQGNYYAKMQDDGHFCVYKKVPGSADVYEWGTGVWVGGKGKYFAAVEDSMNFTVNKGEPNAAAGLLWGAPNLRVLTYNAHLMEDSNIVVGAWIKNQKPVCFQDSRRHDFIIAKIRESGAHIVALQEVWAESRMERFRDQLRDIYPHCAFGATGKSLIPIIAALIDEGLPRHAAGSGVLLLSKFKLSDQNVKIFEGSDDAEEISASKCALSARVTVVGGRTLGLGMTHAWTDAGGDDCLNIRVLVGQVPREVDGTLLMGDFNIHRRLDAEKFKTLNSIMGKIDARDSWTQVHGEKDFEGSVTDDEVHNNLAQFFSPMRNTANPDCIDYIYAASKTTGLSLRPFRAEVLRDGWKYSTKGDPKKWYWVHDGSVSGMPSAATFGADHGKLCVVVKTTENRLLAALTDRKTGRWTHKFLQANGKDIISQGAPSIVWFADTLHLFYEQKQDIYKLESTDGITWSQPQRQNFPNGESLQTSGGLCAIVFQGVLHVFARHPGNPGGNQVCYHTWDRNRWSDRKWARIETEHNISAAVLDDKVLCIVTKDGKGDTGGLMHARLEKVDGQWSNPAQVPFEPGSRKGEITTGSPGIAAHKGLFHLFYREPEGGGIFHRSSTDAKSWTNSDFANHATTDEVCPVSWGDTMLFFFSCVVNEDRKHKVHLKVLYPEESVRYPTRALAHSHWPTDVELDASDHYPYQVDFIYSPRSGK